MMNGIDVGSTQYLDGFQRANFWSLVNGTPYHTAFSVNPTVLPVVSVTVPAGKGSTAAGPCRKYGTIDLTWWDNYVQSTLLPSLAPQGVSPTSFAQIIFDSVFELTPSCCAAGYHSSFLNGGVFQTYSVNTWDTSGIFGRDSSTMSHEVAEWMDDPNGTNMVPIWGTIGQQPNCQSNLEVGDPLSPGSTTPTNPFKVTLNGFTYTLQELAFFSWFYGGVSLGSGGKYSNNGTLIGFANACPPGGTH